MLRHKYQNSSLSMKASTHQFPSPCHSLQGTKGALKGQLILHVLSGHNGRALRYANKGPGQPIKAAAIALRKVDLDLYLHTAELGHYDLITHARSAGLSGHLLFPAG